MFITGTSWTGSKERDSSASNGKSRKFIFFYGKKDVFSQFHPARFTVDGQEYNCMEQYMHYQKAGRYISTVNV